MRIEWGSKKKAQHTQHTQHQLDKEPVFLACQKSNRFSFATFAFAWMSEVHFLDRKNCIASSRRRRRQMGRQRKNEAHENQQQ